MLAFYAATALLLLCITFVVLRPYGLSEAIPPVVGASLAIGMGLEPLTAISGLWGMVSDATLTLAGLMIISLVMERGGFFRWCAEGITRLSGGNGSKAWWGLMLLAWLTTALLANDGAMLILIPIYAEMLLGNTSRAQAFAFLFPVGFLIDVASTPLVTSNLTNIMVADYFGISFGRYMVLMAVPSLVLVVGTLGLMWGVFRRHVPGALRLERPAAQPADRSMLVVGWGGLAALAVGYAGSHVLRWPVSGVVGIVAVAMLAFALGTRRLRLKEVPNGVPWIIPLFALGLFVMVDAVDREGGKGLLTHLWTLGGGRFAPVDIGLSAGLLSALVNNLPSVLLALLGFAHAPALASPASVAACVVGVNVGPKLTPYGSLATLLWINLLAARGFRVGWREYLRYGLVLTPLVLLLGLFAAWFGTRWMLPGSV